METALALFEQADLNRSVLWEKKRSSKCWLTCGAGTILFYFDIIALLSTWHCK